MSFCLSRNCLISHRFDRFYRSNLCIFECILKTRGKICRKFNDWNLMVSIPKRCLTGIRRPTKLSRRERIDMARSRRLSLHLSSLLIKWWRWIFEIKQSSSKSKFQSQGAEGLAKSWSTKALSFFHQERKSLGTYSCKLFCQPSLRVFSRSHRCFFGIAQAANFVLGL